MEEKQPQPPPAKIFKSEEEQEKTIKLLEERLEKHDNNRKTVQDKLTEVLNKLAGQISELEDRINRELCENFSSEEDKLQRALNELRGNSTISALQEAKTELSVVQSYEIIENKEPNNDITTLYELKTERRAIHEGDFVELAISRESRPIHGSSNTTETSEIPCGPDKLAEERERLMELLEERLEKHDNSKKTAQDKLHDICGRLKAQIDELEDRISKKLEDKYASEDNRLQAALNELRGNRTASALQKAKVELLVEQSYKVFGNKEEEEEEDFYYDEDDFYYGEEEEDDDDDSVEPNFDLTTLYELKAERRIVPELVDMRKPINVRVAGMNRGRVSVEFACLNPDEERVLSDNTIVNPVKYKCMLFKKSNEQESKEYPLYKNEGNDSSSFFSFTPDTLETETAYGTRVKMVVGDREHEWSDEVAEFTTPEFSECCMWKKCPGDVDGDMKYIVDENNPRVAININGGWCTIIGNAHIPLNKVVSWSIKVLESRNNDGSAIYIGIAPSDINQNADYNYNKRGWYFNCYYSELFSGPPHNYRNKEYGPRKGNGQYVHTGDSVGVVVDTTKGGFSFVLNGVNIGVAYCGIPLDKPLVPCVLLGYQGDSIELDTSEVKENVAGSSVPVPSNITKKSTTWDSITFSWDKVNYASFYQIEVDGSKSWDASTKNTFTKGRLLPDTEHSFRVRAVRWSSVSEWSDVVKGRTLKESFASSWWKECPVDVYKDMKYIVGEKNSRIATKVNIDDGRCTIIGNTPIPLNKVITWSIKVLESRNNDGCSIFIGIAPNDINQNNGYYNVNCGWYFYCYYSELFSGPPHNYRSKEYGPRKEGGQYVHIGDSVGVVVDTTRGGLSFVLNGVNLGVAYEEIPLDKPLVPCVILALKGGSVELII